MDSHSSAGNDERRYVPANNFFPQFPPATHQREHALKNKIYEFRQQNKCELKDLAEFSGVSLPTLWRMEKGHGTSLKNAFKVADAFRVTIYDVWCIPVSNVPSHTIAPKLPAAGTDRQLRRQYRWRLHDLAKLAHVSKTTLAKIERGHIPTFKHAVRIAEALDVSVYHLWGPTGAHPADM